MREHIVYRMYQHETLLYVGYSGSLASRLASHMRDSAWWSQVTAIEIQRFGSRKAALDHERQAILKEAPTHNTARYPTVGGKTPLRSFRIPDELYADARDRAKAEGRTLTDVLREALVTYIEETEA